MSELQFETRVEDDVTVVRLAGSADLDGAAVLEREMLSLCARRPARVVFDLTDLTAISSLFIGGLVKYRHTWDAWKGDAVLAGATDAVEAALRRCRLDQIFTFAPSVERALWRPE
jgi:anti-anti-sigma factor